MTPNETTSYRYEKRYGPGVAASRPRQEVPMALLHVAPLMHRAREGHPDERETAETLVWWAKFLSLRHLQTVLGASRFGP